MKAIKVATIALIVLFITSLTAVAAPPTIPKKLIPTEGIRKSVLENIRKLYSPDDKQIAIAVRSLGNIGKTAAPAIPFIASLLEGDNKGVRLLSIEALGKIRKPQAIKHIIGFLKDENPAIRKLTVAALGSIKSPNTIEQLIAMLSDKNRAVKKAAAKALHEIKRRNPPIEVFVKALKNSNPAVRLYAISTLFELADKNSVDGLIEALNDKVISEKAAVTLGKIKDTRAVAPLSALITADKLKAGKGSAIRLKVAATKALGEIGDPGAIKPLIDILYDNKSGLRRAAQTALVMIGKPAVNDLMTVVNSEKTIGPRFAAEVIGKIKDPSSVEPLIKILQDKNMGDKRVLAALVLGMIGDKRAVKPLEKVLGDESKLLAKSAQESLNNINAK